MKKYLVVCAAALLLLPCFPLLSQEADDTGAGVGLTIIPRLELTPVFSEGAGALTLGNSSLYSLFEGDITDNLSFSVANHWLSASPAELYYLEGEGANLFRSDWTNWLDWAYLTLQLGNFSISAGKDMITTGGFEFDDYDFDVHPALQSGLWNNLSCYQWGGKIGYTSDSESTYVGLQITSSPYSIRPFDDGSFNLSLEWRGTYGNFSNIWSVTSMGANGIIGNPALMLIALGQRYTAGDFTFGLDWFSHSGDWNEILLNGSSFLGSVSWDPSESLSVLLKGGLEKSCELVNDGMTVSERFGNNYFGGLALHWFPVEGLRLHVMGAYHSFWKTTTLSVGATYYLNL